MPRLKCYFGEIRKKSASAIFYQEPLIYIDLLSREATFAYFTNFLSKKYDPLVPHPGFAFCSFIVVAALAVALSSLVSIRHYSYLKYRTFKKQVNDLDLILTLVSATTLH